VLRILDVEQLRDLLASDQLYALLDIREHGEYSLGHIPGASAIPRGDLEFQILRIIPDRDITTVLYCDDGQRSELAAVTLTALGYRRVSILNGGLKAWRAAGFPLDEGIKTRGKETAERLAVETGVRELSIRELLQRQEKGELVYIIDTRPPEEFRLGHIPGSFNVPGGQLLLDAEFITVVKNATIVTCCAGRTRAVMGAYLLRQMGLPNVYALVNGVLAWSAEGLLLEAGPEPVTLPSTQKQGIRTVTASQLRRALQHTDAPTVIDLRPKGIFASGHIPGACWLARGMLELHLRGILCDDYSAIVFCCETGEWSELAAGQAQNMGLVQVRALSRGMAAWREAGFPLEIGFQGIDQVTPADINDMVRVAGAGVVPEQALQAAMREKMDIFDRVKQRSSVQKK